MKYTQGDSKFGRQAGSKLRKPIKTKEAVLINTAALFFNRFSAAFNPAYRPNFESPWAYIPFLCIPLSILFGGSMLSEAELVEKKYAPAIAKIPPPSLSPRTDSLLNAASVWFDLDLNSLKIPNAESALAVLNEEFFWDTLQDLGVDALYLRGLKPGGSGQTSLNINPKWGNEEWPKITINAQKRSIGLIGDAIGYTTGLAQDFELALQNVANYPALYHLIQIDPIDWQLLPQLSTGAKSANIPWLALQQLYKKGYIPENSRPYEKKSDWNATGKIIGADGIVRRWIYLTQNQNNPILSWLSPSFAANRLASGDALNMFYNLSQKIHCLDAALPPIARTAQSLIVRKIGGFTVQKKSRGLQELKSNPCDAAIDTLTGPAFLHALITENTQVLRLIYRSMLEEGISQNSLVRTLLPFDPFLCDWTEFLSNPKKNYVYFEEQISAELLRKKLLKEDLSRLSLSREEILPLSTWPGYCALTPSTMKIKEFEKKAEQIQKAHELLAFTYAMQPGIFSFSAADLLGALPQEATSLDLMGPNPNTLYGAVPMQLRNPRSFASNLKKILSIRKNSHIAQGELIAVAPVRNQSTLLLIHRLAKSRFIQLLAINFGSKTSIEQIERAEIQQTSAIELLSSLTQNKVFDSAAFTFELPPLSGKVFLFQPKYFD